MCEDRSKFEQLMELLHKIYTAFCLWSIALCGLLVLCMAIIATIAGMVGM